MAFSFGMQLTCTDHQSCVSYDMLYKVMGLLCEVVISPSVSPCNTSDS